jgi:hypothetical protein
VKSAFYGDSGQHASIRVPARITSAFPSSAYLLKERQLGKDKLSIRKAAKRTRKEKEERREAETQTHSASQGT